MKKFVYILWAVSCIMMTACSDDDSIPEITSLNVVESVIDFDAIGGEGFLKVENGSAEMNVSSNTDWCSIKDVTNDKITFSIAKNNNRESRSAVISMEIDGQSKQVCVTQVGVVSIFEPGQYKRFGNAAFNAKLSVSSTLPISVSIGDEDKKWLNYKEVEGGIEFNGTANDTGEIRWTKVTISSGETSSYYYFMQYDIEDIIGNYMGVAQIKSTYMQVDGYYNMTAEITSGNNGKYTILLPDILGTGKTMSLNATYQNGIFVITTPQAQNYKVQTLYGCMITGVGTQLFLQRNVGIAPIVSENEVMLSYASDYFLVLGLFTGPNGTGSFAQHYTEFPAMLMLKAS